MKLSVPLVRQDKGSYDCGPAGLAMILEYYKQPTTVEGLKKELQVYENLGTYAPQLGKYLLDKEFAVELVMLNPYLFTLSTKMDHEEQIAYFQELKERAKKEKFQVPIKHFLEFLEAGGTLNIKIPDAKDLQEEIRNERPVGALLTSNFLHEEKANFNFHFNIITGIDEEKVIVNDPNMEGEQEYAINDFFYGIYASAAGDIDNACLIKIRKN